LQVATNVVRHTKYIETFDSESQFSLLRKRERERAGVQETALNTKRKLNLDLGLGLFQKK